MGEKGKIQGFKMFWNLSYQLKINYYKLLYLSLMVATKKIPIVDKQKIMRKKSKHITKESHHTKEDSKRKKETELQNKIK